MTGPDPLDYGWWLASRSAGIVAFLGVSVSVLCGLLMANNLPRRRGAKKQLLAVHEIAALSGLAALAAHGLLLLGDGWLKPGITGIAIPFTMDYRPAFTGLGILAGWTHRDPRAELLPAPPDRRRSCGARCTAGRSPAGRSPWSTCSAPGRTPASGGFRRSSSSPRCRSPGCSPCGCSGRTPAPRPNRPADGSAPRDALPRSAQRASGASPRRPPVRRAGPPAAGRPNPGPGHRRSGLADDVPRGRVGDLRRGAVEGPGRAAARQVRDLGAWPGIIGISTTSAPS